MAEQRLNPSLNDKVKGLLGDLERDIITPLLGIKKLFFSGTETANALTGTEKVTILQGGEPVVTTTQDIADLAAGPTAPYKLYTIRYNASQQVVFQYLEDNNVSFITEINNVYILGLPLNAKTVVNVSVSVGASATAITFNKINYIGGGPFIGRYDFEFKKIQMGEGTTIVTSLGDIFNESNTINSITIELKVYN
jgi:hypothetical protein